MTGRRTPTHYRQMLDSNPSASIGTTLAARMVYAAQNGTADEPEFEQFREIVRDLRSRYGETLTPDECRREMMSCATHDIPHLCRPALKRYLTVSISPVGDWHFAQQNQGYVKIVSSPQSDRLYRSFVLSASRC